MAEKILTRPSTEKMYKNKLEFSQIVGRNQPLRKIVCQFLIELNTHLHLTTKVIVFNHKK